MDRDNVGMVLRLQPKHESNGTKPPFLVANTHLLFNKNRGDIKLLQMATLLAEIEEIAKVRMPYDEAPTTQNAYTPVIICGDFNSTPFSPLYNFVVDGKLQYSGLSKKHISGQNSPQKKMHDNSFLNHSLIPVGLNISGLCQKRDISMMNSDGAEIASNDTQYVDDTDCYVVAEKINGKECILEEPGVLKHLLRFESAYRHYLADGRPEVSTCHSEVSTCVDYIMFSQGVDKVLSKKLSDDVSLNVTRKQLYLSSLLTLLGGEDISAMGKLPNVYLSSDHLALLARFKLFD